MFRSRHRAWDAFDALVALLGLVGHREPGSRMRELPRAKGSQIVAFRRIEEWVPSLERLFAGESPSVLRALATKLLEKSDARREAAQVGSDLRLLDDFFESDARPLREALRAAGRAGCFVSQEERDSLFIEHRHGAHASDSR